MKTALAVLLALTPVSVLASEYQSGYSASRTCFKTEYREEYIPGTEDNPGYVKSWKDTIEVPCKNNPDVGWRRTNPPERPYYRRHVTVYEDTNDCTDGKIAGGLVGGGVGAAGTWTPEGSIGVSTSKSVGVNTTALNDPDVQGIGNSFQGLYIGNGMLMNDNALNGNHYIGTAFGGMMAGPVTINGVLTVDGSYVVV